MAIEDDEKYVEAHMKRMMRLNRVFEGRSRDVSKFIGVLNKDVIARVKKKFPNASKARIDQLNREIRRRVVDQFNNGVIDENTKLSEEIIKREAKWAEGVLSGFNDVPIKAINEKKVVRRALNKTYQGHTFRFWFNAATQTTAKRLESALVSAQIQGLTTADAVRQVEAILKRSDADVKTLTRSFLQHSAVEARTENFKVNQEAIEGYHWVSVLDARTTFDICGIRDNLFYDINFKPVNHSLPWDAGPGRIHFNCRSIFVAKPKGSGDLRNLISRPAVGSGENYEAGDKFTRTGKPRKASRFSTKEKGILKVTQTRGTTNYENFLRRQKSAYVADVIGDKSLVADFKAGRLSLLDVAKRGSSLEVNQL